MRADRICGVVLLIVLTGLVILQAGVSLTWRFAHDTSVLLYEAYLIDARGYVPYRDFWDINLPGTHLAHVVLGRLTGYTTGIRLRVVDLLYLVTLLTVTFAWLRRLGRRVAGFATVLFAAFYLTTDFRLLVQREYLALLPIVGAAMLATELPKLRDVARCAAIGLLFGLVATMKPHLTAALPVVLVFALLEIRARAPSQRLNRGRILLLVASAVAAAGVPPIVALGYLVARGAWPSFLGIVRGYYPIYAYVTSTLDVIPPGPERTLYMVRSFLGLGGHLGWLVPAALGVFAAFGMSAWDPRRKRQALLICALTGVFAIYPVFTGQFFEYHWIPFVFFLLCAVSLCFLEMPASAPAWRRWLVLLVAVVYIVPRSIAPLASGTSRFYLEGLRPAHPYTRAVETIAEYLRGRLQPGDKVQPLDWVEGGVLQALLAARADCATPYLADVVFYCNVSDPYARDLREDFLRRLASDPPRFVVEFMHEPWLGGPGTTGEFAELRRWIDGSYRVVVDLGTHRIYERVGA